MLTFPQRHLLRTILQAKQNTTKPWRAIKQIEHKFFFKRLRVINLFPFFDVNTWNNRRIYGGCYHNKPWHLRELQDQGSIQAFTRVI